MNIIRVFANFVSYLSPSATKVNTYLSPSATKVNTYLSPSATKVNTYLSPSATKVNTYLSPSATKVNTYLSPSATKVKKQYIVVGDTSMVTTKTEEEKEDLVVPSTHIRVHTVTTTRRKYSKSPPFVAPVSDAGSPSRLVAYASLLILCLQNATQVLLIRHARTRPTYVLRFYCNPRVCA